MSYQYDDKFNDPSKTKANNLLKLLNNYGENFIPVLN